MNAPAATAPLRALQRSFAAALRCSTRGPLRAVAAGRSAFTPTRRIAVYRSAYSARLVDVLASDYPALRAWLGGDAFARLAQRYLAAHPSRHPNLNRFGARLPAFLRGCGPRTPFAAALARFELALTRAFDAAEMAPLAAATLATLPAWRWQRARLTVHASVQVLRVPAAVLDAFAAWRGGTPPPRARQCAVHVLVWRRNDQVAHVELPRAAAKLLRQLQRGVPLARAVDGVATAAPLQQWFARWSSDGVFAAVR